MSISASQGVGKWAHMAFPTAVLQQASVLPVVHQLRFVVHQS
jgi:hypothetical protein